MIMIEKDGMYFDWFRVKFVKSEKPLKEQHTRHYGSLGAALRSINRYSKLVDFTGVKLICANF